MIHLVVLATAVCLVSSGCIYSGGQGRMFDQDDDPGPLAPVIIPLPKFVKPVPPPAGFSSTYQRYLIDRQRLARKTEQEALVKAAGNDTPVKDSRAESR